MSWRLDIVDLSDPTCSLNGEKTADLCAISTQIGCETSGPLLVQESIQPSWKIKGITALI